MGKKGIGEDTLVGFEEIESEDIENSEEVVEEDKPKTYRYKINTTKFVFQGKTYTANKDGIVELPQQNIKGLKKA